MLIIKNQRFGMRKYNEELNFARQLLKVVGAVNVKLSIYSKYPDKFRGKLIYSADFDISSLQEFRLANFINLRDNPINDLISEFDFIIRLKDKEISGYLRVNNEFLRKNYGDIEMDIYPFDSISSLGDLIREYDLVEMKDAIENVVKKYPKQFDIFVKQAFIGVSFGEPFIDFSKRIWGYYSQPYFLIEDLISFIKNFNEIELEEGVKVPKYLLPEYESIIHKIRPYSISFLSKEFMSSKKFSERFEKMVSEKEIIVKKGSLIISSNNLENNFLLARELSEKMIFPVMKQVTGDVEFRNIIDTTY